MCDGELCCATTVDNSGVYVCYLKSFVSVYFRCPARTVVSLEHAFTCVSTTNQAERRSRAAHLLARWEQDRTTVRVNHNVILPGVQASWTWSPLADSYKYEQQQEGNQAP